MQSFFFRISVWGFWSLDILTLLRDFSRVVSKHCVSLASPCLTVHKNSSVDPVKRTDHDVLAGVAVYIGIDYGFIVTTI